jgi:hypothetical protein
VLKHPYGTARGELMQDYESITKRRSGNLFQKNPLTCHLDHHRLIMFTESRSGTPKCLEARTPPDLDTELIRSNTCKMCQYQYFQHLSKEIQGITNALSSDVRVDHSQGLCRDQVVHEVQ